MISRGFRSSSDRVTAAAEAAIAGVLSLSPHLGQHTMIFVPNRTLHKPLFSLSKHKHLPQATRFTAALAMQCFLHPHTTLAVYPLPVKLRKKPSRADPRIFACDWPGPWSKDYHLAELQVEAQLLHLPQHIPPQTLKSLPFRLWKDDQDARADPPCCKWTNDIIPVPMSSSPLDLVLGTLSLGQRRAMSAVLQAFTLHCFCGAYSQRMHPTSGDVTTCPCTFTQTPIPMIELDWDGDPQLKDEGDREWPRGRSTVARPHTMPRQTVSIANHGIVDLMAEHLDPRQRTPTPPPPPYNTLRRPQRGRRRCGPQTAASPPPAPVLHSAPHIIDSRSPYPCPLVSEFRSCILMDSTIRYLFWTFKGAALLATFLLRSNSLLRPLPPRPDPP